MDELALLHARFSCRAYQPDPVPREVITKLLEAARWAPSGGNLQPWRFVVVLDLELRRGLAQASYRQSFVASAPVVIAVCAVPEESARVYRARGRELYCLQDTAAATENLLLGATALGLGACWVGAFDEAAVAALLGLDPQVRPVALVPIGFPAESPGRRRRRSLDEVVTWRE